MKYKLLVVEEREFDIAYVMIDVPVKYENEDMPHDFPFRVNDQWKVLVEMDTGRIVDWPEDRGTESISMKVCDEGRYILLDSSKAEVARIEEDYVPNRLIPGEYGDYLVFTIKNGRITEWPKTPDVSSFFRAPEKQAFDYKSLFSES